MSPLARNLLVAGVIFTLVLPVLGLMGIVFFMVRAFHDLGQNGITDPSQLAGHIGYVLIATAVGLLFVIPGIAMLISAGCLIFSERRKGVR